MPSTILLADSSTVLTSKSSAKGALNTPMGIYHHKFREVRANTHLTFQDQSSAQGGGGLITRTLRYFK